MNIYLPVEIKSRELEGKLLLALTAAQRGHIVILGEKSHTRSLAAKGILPPGILHNKSLTPSDKTIELLMSLKNHGHVITCQDEESGLIDESYEPFAHLRFSEATVEKTDKIFAWGNHDASTLKKVFADHQDKFIATGSPRVDLWRSDMSAYYDSGPVSDKAKTIKPFILISSNFSAFLNQNRFFDVIGRLRDANYFDRNPKWEQFQYDNFAYQSRLIFEFIKLIRELSAGFPELNILLRPHPVESVEGWNKALGSYSNVHVVREGAIGSWLKECALLIHNGCTTAIEAAALCKPRIAFRPIPDPIEREIPNNISYQAFSAEEVRSFISKIVKNTEIPDSDKVAMAKKEILDERFSNLNGHLAADRIVDEWERFEDHLGAEQTTAEELTRKKDAYLSEKSSFMRTMKGILVDLIQRDKNNKNVSKEVKLDSSHKFPSFDDEEYHQLKNDLNRALNRFDGVRFMRFGEKSIILYSG